MKADKKISHRIFYSILVGALIIIISASLISYYYTRRVLLNLTISLIEQTLVAAYNKVESEALPIIRNAENNIFFIRHSEKELTDLILVLEESFQNIPGLIGAGLCIRERDADSITVYFKRESQKSLSLKSAPFQKTFSDFPGESESYRISSSIDTLTLNYYYGDSNSKIYLNYDIRLTLFAETLSEYSPNLEMRHYLFDKKFNSILNPSAILDSIAILRRNEEIASIRSNIEKKRFGLLYYPDYSRGQALYSSKLAGTNLILASIIEISDISNQLRRINLIVFSISGLALILLILIQKRIVYRLILPLEQLVEISKQIQKGKLHLAIPDYSSDKESAELALSLRTFQERMQRYVSNLNATLKQKRAMTQELNIAERIQLDMLPDLHQALTDIPEIDIYCSINPARGVAGDFFDYSMLDEDRFFFIIGDVSGKGIPAALFMVKTLTLFRTEVIKEKALDEIFCSVSDLLTRNNEEGMFVTAIGGIMNYKTGELTLCDAGHNTPLRSSFTEQFYFFELNKSTPLGIMPDMKYSSTYFQLKHGDTLFLYTDGLPEATNSKDEMFGEDRILKSLEQQEGLELEKIFKHSQTVLNEFVGSATQSDDITIILLRYQNEVD